MKLWKAHLPRGEDSFASNITDPDTGRSVAISFGDMEQAKMIAAAPYMLDALRRILEQESRYQDSVSAIAAADAIRKASG